MNSVVPRAKRLHLSVQRKNRRSWQGRGGGEETWKKKSEWIREGQDGGAERGREPSLYPCSRPVTISDIRILNVPAYIVFLSRKQVWRWKKEHTL